MSDTIFTKIIKGEVPCHKIYEDDKTLAFLDIYPAGHGHTLVVTKLQIDQYLDLPEEDYIALWVAVKKVAQRLKSVLGVDRVRVSIVGTDVPHVHVHLIPFNEGAKKAAADHDRMAIDPDHESLASLARKLAF